MGNETETRISLDESKDTIIWIDSNIYNFENKSTYEHYLPNFNNFNFIRFLSVKSAIRFLRENKYFEFRLTYAIVSGRLAEEFFNEYVKISEQKNIIIATSVYCYRQKYHETKPYFKDVFLNTGGITFIFDDIINYILKDECRWGTLRSFKYTPRKASFGNTFTNIDSTKKYELTLPILIGTLINASLLEKGDISNFQKLLLRRYYNKNNRLINYLIKPSGNKNMDIPLHLLTKSFLRFYTEETPKFYSDLNKDLTNDKFDEYHPFIFLIYNGLNKGYLKSYKDGILYRGTALSNQEFQEMTNNFNLSKQNKNLKSIYYAKNFLSFSKNKNKAKEFLTRSIFKGCTTILFQIIKPKNEKFFVSNVDISSLSSIGEEEEVLFLPLSCFEIIDISSEKNYKGVKYVEVTLKYLDDYEENIKKEIEEIKKDEKAINNFFEKSMNSKYGNDVQKYYDKKCKISVSLCKLISATPCNNFFLNKVGTGFIHKLNKYMNKDNAAQIHIDDEIPNIISEKNKFKKFFTDLLKKLDNKQYDHAYSIGVCLGNFFYNFESFKNSPNSAKIFNLSTLALAIGLPTLKLIPVINNFIKTRLFTIGTHNINISTVLNGLNILSAVYLECVSIFSFAEEHKKNIILCYAAKRGIKLAIGVGSSVLGNVLGKLVLYGIKVIFGIALGPLATFIIGAGCGAACGYLGAQIGDKISNTVFGEDQFVLRSSHLYYKYIPMKYRQQYCNPNLKWNKTYLCKNVKSYIIECVINEAELIMLVINIPKDIYELEECLGYKDYNKDTDFDNQSVSTQLSDEGEKNTKIFTNGKYGGDLIIPYKGIQENCYSINFIIYGINEKIINYKDWLSNKRNEKAIEIVFNLSVY